MEKCIIDALNVQIQTYKWFLTLKSAIFWDITPCNKLKVNRRFGRAYYLLIQLRRTSQVRNQNNAVSKQSCSPETSVYFRWITRRYIPEDRTVHDNSWQTSNTRYLTFFTFSKRNCLWNTLCVVASQCGARPTKHLFACNICHTLWDLLSKPEECTLTGLSNPLNSFPASNTEPKEAGTVVTRLSWMLK